MLDQMTRPLDLREAPGQKDAGELPPVLDLPRAARMLGVGRTCAYELVRTGQWPTPVLRLGRLIRIPTAPLLELLGMNSDVARA